MWNENMRKVSENDTQREGHNNTWPVALSEFCYTLHMWKEKKQRKNKDAYKQ